MKRVFWLVFVFLLIAVPVLSSCTQNVPEAPPEVETEPTQTATQTPTPTPEPTQTVTQTPPPTPEPKPASFSVNALTITPKEVTPGSSAAIEVLVTNSGELSGTYDVTLKIDDTIEHTKKITLEGGASQKVTFGVIKWTARAYSVSIAGQSGTLAVKSLPLPAMDSFMKGFNFTDWNFSGKPRPPNVGPLYYPPYTDSRLKDLAATGTNWIAVLVNILQDTIASTEVRNDQYATPSVPALRHMIDLAHSLGMRVALTPNIQFNNEIKDLIQNHIYIGTAFTTEEQWQAWFTSYRQIVVQYASLAQDAGVDMFFIGNELGSTTHREADWRRIAQEVRQVYKGPIIYEALQSPLQPPFSEEQRIKWWDAVDYIGVLGYYPLTNRNNPTVEELKSAWVERGWLVLLENLSKKYQKPIIISEIGYLSSDGINTDPPYHQKFAQAPLDLQEQADCYQAAFEVLWGKSWLKGIFWWQWFANPVWWPGGPTSKTEEINGKPAEEIIKKYYLPPDKPQ